jgi:hypothetical protein
LFVSSFCGLPFAAERRKASHDEMNDAADRDVVVFTEALRLPAVERAGYLDRACAGDGELRRRLEAILRGYVSGEIEWMQNWRFRMGSSSLGFYSTDSLKTLLPSSPF